jgi:hypothetical protein
MNQKFNGRKRKNIMSEKIMLFIQGKLTEQYLRKELNKEKVTKKQEVLK